MIARAASAHGKEVARLRSSAAALVGTCGPRGGTPRTGRAGPSTARRVRGRGAPRRVFRPLRGSSAPRQERKSAVRAERRVGRGSARGRGRAGAFVSARPRGTRARYVRSVSPQRPRGALSLPRAMRPSPTPRSGRRPSLSGGAWGPPRRERQVADLSRWPDGRPVRSRGRRRVDDSSRFDRRGRQLQPDRQTPACALAPTLH